MTFKIADTPVGKGHPAFIIAEIAQAHDGSLGTAHAYIDAVAKSGVNAIKFQTHIANAESSQDEKFRANVFPQDATRYDYWRRMEFTSEQWEGLMRHSEERGLIFLSTPFSSEAVELLDRLNVAAWKISSGEVGNTPMLRQISRTGRPVLLSSGMSSWADIDDAIGKVSEINKDFAIFQCTTSYPCPPEKVGLNVMRDMAARYKCPVGLSDHSGTIFPSIAAATLGANLIEIHAVFSKECFGPDVGSSVTTSELAELVRGVRFVEAAIGSQVDKDACALELKELAELFGKSLYARRDLPEGHVLTANDVALKKPGTGIPAKRLDEFLGCTLSRPFRSDEQLQENGFTR